MRPLFAVVLLAAVAAAQDASWEGVWKTTYGRMELKQNGADVSGMYGGTSTIEGKVEGRKLTFTYAEPNVKGQGWFELAADGKSFAGKWKEDGKEAWGDWKGARLAVGAGAAFAGVFKTDHGPIRFTSTEAGVSAVYAYDNSPGQMTGTVEGRKLTFSWSEGGSTGDGWFELAADGRTFKGAWRMKGKEKWTDWTGERVVARPGIRWLIVVESQWEKKLSDQEYSFGRMLKAYFARFPNVQVRHRRFGDATDFKRAAAPIAFLPEPTIVVFVSHGKDGKLQAGQEMVGPEAVGQALRGASNVQAVHFSACSMMHAGVPEKIRAAAGVALPISGYAVDVDWSASAVLEMLYFDMVLGRGMDPEKAAALIAKELTFAGDKGVKGSPFGASKFRFTK